MNIKRTLEKLQIPVGGALVTVGLCIAVWAALPLGTATGGWWVVLTDTFFLTVLLGSIGLVVNRKRLFAWNYLVAGFIVAALSAFEWGELLLDVEAPYGLRDYVAILASSVTLGAVILLVGGFICVAFPATRS